MKVESYTKQMSDGRLVKCSGYTRKVKYVIFFRTLGEYQRFRLLFDDPESHYEIIDLYQRHYFKLNGDYVQENKYLDRLMIRSESEDRDLLIKVLGLRALKKDERNKRDVRPNMCAYEAV